jgi:hypothetical protein
MEKTITLRVWRDLFPPRQEPLIIENDTELYYFVSFDERRKNPENPSTVIEHKDGFEILCSPDEHRPIVIEKNIRRIRPEDPLHLSTRFDKAFQERTRDHPLGSDDAVKAFWERLSARIDSLSSFSGDDFLCELGKIPEIALVPRSDYDGKTEPVGCVPLEKAIYVALKVHKKTEDLLVLPGYRNSSLDLATTREFERELEVLGECLDASIGQNGNGVQVMGNWLPRNEFFLEYENVQSLFFESLSGTDWHDSRDAFAYGANATYKGWMYEVTKDVIVPGGLLIAKGHYKVDCDLWRMRQENPELSSMLTRKPAGLPTRYFVDVGHFPALHMTVYGRLEDTTV